MSTFLLTLVRHGETAENKLKIVQGHTDTKLVERGVKQAVLVGQRLASEAFTHVFSSDLSRALEMDDVLDDCHFDCLTWLTGFLALRLQQAGMTCEIIMSRNRADSAPITLDSRLRERKLGVLEGQSHLNCQKSIKTSKKNLLLGMETKTEVRERAKSFFRELCRIICKGSSDPSNHETSNTGNSFQCPCCKSQDCKCPLAALPPIPRSLGSERGPGQVLLCNVAGYGSRMSKHLKNGAPPALENPHTRMSLSLESSSDEEHLGITPDVLQLGRQLRPGDRDSAEGLPKDHSSALNENSLWGKYGSCEGLQNEGQGEEGRSVELPEDGDQSQHKELANVLLVSHGGFLLELINYFFKELKCKSPLDPRKAEVATSSAEAVDVEHSRRSIMSNAGLSRFAISINDKLAKPTTVTCLYLNDRKHLLGEFDEEEEEEGDSVAGSDIVC